MENKIYGEAIPTPDQKHQWAAVLFNGEGREINRAPADCEDEALKLVKYFLSKLAAYARRGFEIEDADPR